MLFKTLFAGGCASVLLLAGCIGPESVDSKDPHPSASLLVQSPKSDISGKYANVEASLKVRSQELHQDIVGASFVATDLADPRLDPDSSNSDEDLMSLGSPALPVGGNVLDRRTFWTSKGEKPQCSEETKITPDDLKRLKKRVDATGSSQGHSQKAV